MKRLFVLFVAIAVPAFAQESQLVTPQLSKPATEAATGDAQHEKYEAAWFRYEQAITKVTADVNAALDAQFGKAADAGNLDLADMWDKKKKAFLDTGTVAWPSDAKAKAEWRRQFPTVAFPGELVGVITTARAGYLSAAVRLKEDYGVLIKDYTKARNLERAKAVRDEVASLEKRLAASEPHPQTAEKQPDVKTKDSKPRRKIALTGVAPRSKDVLNSWWGVDKLPGQWTTPCRIIVNKQICESFLFAHAPSKVVFDLPAGAKRFTAMAVCPAGIPPSGNPDFVGDWICAVAVDGRQVFRERLGNRELPIEVEIPPGAKTLTLIGDPNGRNNWDCVIWAFPILEID